MTWAELRPAFAKRRYPCAERASAHGLIARNNQEATSDWRAGSELEKDDFVKNKDNQNQTIEVENNNIDYQYVCNTSTMKFHYCYCNSVSKMSDKNKKYTNETREELIEQGYTSCGNCNPQFYEKYSEIIRDRLF